MTSKPRYLVVGTGHRVRMYFGAMAGPHRDAAELVGVDRHQPRPAGGAPQLAGRGGSRRQSVVTGQPDDLERMIADTRADRVIITSPDYTHADLIVRSAGRGRRRGRREAADHRPRRAPGGSPRRSSGPAVRSW